MLDDVVSSFESHSTGHFASLSRISVFLSIEQREKVNLPSHNTALLHDIFHFIEFYSLVICCSMHLKLFLSLEGFATLRTRHFESGLKSYILVCVDFSLLGMVHTVLFLSNLVLYSLSMFLVQLFAQETLHTSATLVLALACSLKGIVGAQTTCTLTLRLFVKRLYSV